MLLVRAVGLPLPHTSPKRTNIQRAYQLRYVPDRFIIGALADTEQPQGRASLIKAALSLVRTPPFDASRPGAFHWASDLCFERRMRIKINEATRLYEENTDESDTTWAQVIRLAVIMGA